MEVGVETLGWGIVGLGKHADHYLAPAIGKARNARLVAVCSRDRSKADGFAARHAALRGYDSLEALLSDREVDVVCIATPNSLHAGQTILAAAAGKHVLCEKPMALSVADCQQMIEVCRKNRVKLGVGFQNRHHPAHAEARRLILSGAVGDVNFATAQYCHGWTDRSLGGWRADPKMSGGGSLMGAGLHGLDLLRYLLGKEVEEVVAATDAGQPNRPVEEIVLSTLRFREGPYAVAVAGLHIPRSYNHLVIYGTKARITGINTVGMLLKGELHVEGDGFVQRMEFPVPEPEIGCYVLQVEAFNRCILEDTEPNASGLDGLEMVRLAQAILDSSRQGRSVRIERE